MNSFIVENELSPRDLVRKFNVKYIGTTDHPLDDLEWHQKIKEDDSFDTVVAPTFRPDEAYVSHANFAGFAEALAEKTGKEIKDYASFMDAMADRIQFFAENGARASDISLDGIVYEAADKETLNAIFNKAINGEDLSEQEVVQWQTEVFVELARLYKEHNFVTLVHFGAVRNNNTPYSSEIGADSGFDSMGDQTDFANGLNAVLDRLARDGNLPKMVWFNLNPTYNTVLANTLANYQANDEGIAGKIQFGAGWWFNDTKLGMIDQMNAYADQGILAHFIGMLTDSRSFLSFQRHDYFRRILASYIGKWVDEEEIPNDEALLRPLIEDICYENAVHYFN